MRRFRQISLVFALVACAIPATPALAKNTQELGRPHGGFDFPPPDCPENCQALAQVSGFQSQLGDAHDPFRIRRSGYVTAFTIALSKPNADQLSFFKAKYGDTPSVRLSLIHPDEKKHDYKLLKQTQAFKMEPYFGSAPTIALRQPFRVRKKDIIAITVPTWLPAFAHNVASDQAWRSSHSGDECTASDPPTAAHEDEDSVKTYGCFYRTARLLYSATFIGDPPKVNVASTR